MCATTEYVLHNNTLTIYYKILNDKYQLLIYSDFSYYASSLSIPDCRCLFRYRDDLVSILTGCVSRREGQHQQQIQSDYFIQCLELLDMVPAETRTGS